MSKADDYVVSRDVGALLGSHAGDLAESSDLKTVNMSSTSLVRDQTAAASSLMIGDVVPRWDGSQLSQFNQMVGEPDVMVASAAIGNMQDYSLKVRHKRVKSLTCSNKFNR